MGLPFSQQPGPVVPATGVLAPPEAGAAAAPVVVAVDEGESAPGLSAPPDDIAGDVAVVGCPPLTSSWDADGYEYPNCAYTDISIGFDDQFSLYVFLIFSLFLSMSLWSTNGENWVTTAPARTTTLSH